MKLLLNLLRPKNQLVLYRLITGFIFLCCLIETADAQEKILEFNTNYPDVPVAMQNSFTLVDDNTNDFTVFLSTRSDIAAYHFDSSMVNQGRLLSRQLPNKFITPLGGTIKGKEYSLFYTNNTKNKFAVLIFDFDARWSSVFEIDLKLKNETLLTHFNYENKFHMVTVAQREKQLFLYTFNDTGDFNKRTISLVDHDFLHISDYPVRLKTALSCDIPARALTEVRWIQKDVPYSLDSLTSLYKIYILKDEMHLIFDVNGDFTQVISHNLKTEATGFKKLPQPEFRNEALTNSYLCDGKLFQFKINPEETTLRITDFETNNILKDHRIKKEEDLYLSVSPIVQRGGRYKDYRELSQTSQFLRKVGKGNPGIYVDDFGGRYSITLGSVKDIDNSALQALAFVNPFTAFVSMGSVTLFVNPVAMAFYRASDTKSVYINGFLDKKLNAVEGEQRGNIFYTISDYLAEEDIKRFTAADVFIYKNHYIFGMLDKKSKKYIFQKFEMH